MNRELENFLEVKENEPIVQISEATERNGKYTEAYPIGLNVFDESMMGGTREGDLIVITGMSGEGKTTLAQNISLNLANLAFPCLWFSYEVVMDNLYAKFKQMAELSEKDASKMLLFSPKRLASGNLKWIKEKIKEGIDKEGTKFIFIDHIDFLTPSNLTDNQRRIMFRDICTELKQMAVFLKVSIFLIAHVKKVQGRAIEMQDIAECSGIYQLADFVFAISRKKTKQNMGGNMAESFGDGGVIRILKNRINGQLPFSKFLMNDNIIVPI